jgi:putative acetyltransferase
MTSISVRLATIEDADAYGVLLAKVFSQNLPTLIPRSGAPSDQQIASFVTTHDGIKSALFLAIVDNTIVGSLNLTRHARPQVDHVVSLGMNVAKEMRGQGVGKTLLQTALEWVKVRRFAERIELEVLENNFAGIRLYEQFGFVLEGRKECSVKQESGYVATLMYAAVLL